MTRLPTGAIMNTDRQTIAASCIHAAETGKMSFPEVIGALMAAGFESYAIDFRRSTATYFTPDGDSIELQTHHVDEAVSSHFDADALHAAIREAQQQVAGYTYTGFCNKAALAGCAGYIVSFTGRRAVYFGRTAETHVEHFPS